MKNNKSDLLSLLLKSQMIKGNDPAYDIANFINYKKSKFDIVVMGNKGRGMTKEALFGSVSNYLVHKVRYL